MDHRGKKGRNHEYQDSNDSASTPELLSFNPHFRASENKKNKFSEDKDVYLSERSMSGLLRQTKRSEMQTN